MRRLFGKAVSALFLVQVMGALILGIGFFFLPGMPGQWALWPLLAAFLALGGMQLFGKRRAIGSVVGLAAFLGLAAWLYPREGGVPLLLVVLVLYVLIVRAWRDPPFTEWAFALLLLGFLAYFAGIIVGRVMELPELSRMMRNGLVLFVPTLLLYSNRQYIVDSASTRGGKQPPKRIRRANFWMTLPLAAVFLVITNLQAIRDAFYAVGNAILRFFAWLMELLAREPEEMLPEVVEGAPGMMDMFPAEAVEEAGNSILMDILGVIVAVALAGALCFMLYRAARLLWRGAKVLIARVRAAAQQLGEGVEDQTESILDWEEVRLQMRERVRRLRGRPRQPKWEALDSRARVRWLYARWQQKQRGVAASMTAREALRAAGKREEAAALYEQARYSAQEVAEAEVAAMREIMEREA